MIYTILAGSRRDPRPPGRACSHRGRLELPGCNKEASQWSNLLGVCLCVRELILYQQRKGLMPCIHSIKRSDSGHSIHASMPRSDAGNAERWPLIKGRRGGCHGVTEMRGHKGNKLSGNKSLHRVGRYAY